MQKIYLNETQKAFVDKMLLDLKSQSQVITRDFIRITRSIISSEKLCTQFRIKHGNFMYIFENYGNEMKSSRQWNLVAKIFDL